MKKLSKIIAMISLICVLFSLLPGCAPKVDLKDVEKDPTGAIREAIAQTINEINAVSYNPLKTGAEAVNGGQITASFTNPDGQEIQYTLNQNPADKKYSTTMLNTAAQSGWKWLLDKGTAYWQIGGENSEFYSINIQDPAAAISNSKIAELLNVSQNKAVERLMGKYPSFLERYNAGEDAKDINTKIAEEILEHIASCDTSVTKTQAVKGSNAIDVVEVSYTVPSDKMEELVKAIKAICENNSKDYDAYVDDLFRHILLDAGCDIYAKSETKNEYSEKWGYAINDLELYLIDSDASFNLSFAISQETGNLVNLSVYSTDELDGENVIIQIGLDFDEKHEKESNWLFSFQATSRSKKSYDSHITITGQIRNQSNHFSNSAVFEYQDSYEVWKDSKLTEYNKQDNSFAVYTTRDSEELIVSGTVTVMGQEMRMSIQSIQHQNTDYALNVSITANNVFDSNNAPMAKDVTTLSENALKTIQTKIIENMPESVFGSWKSEEEFDPSIYKTFRADYDYDGDGDCGDSDDRIFFDIFNQMLNQDNAN